MDFNKLKQQITKEVKAGFMELDIHKAPAYTVKKVYIYHTVKQDDMIEGLKELNKLITDYKNCLGFELTSYNDTEWCSKCGNYKETKNTSYTISRFVFKGRQHLASTIKEQMMDTVSALIAKDLDVSYVELNCNVMDRYKAGTIDWVEVLELHKPCGVYDVFR